LCGVLDVSAAPAHGALPVEPGQLWPCSCVELERCGRDSVCAVGACVADFTVWCVRPLPRVSPSPLPPLPRVSLCLTVWLARGCAGLGTSTHSPTTKVSWVLALLTSPRISAVHRRRGVCLAAQPSVSSAVRLHTLHSLPGPVAAVLRTNHGRHRHTTQAMVGRAGARQGAARVRGTIAPVVYS
jgi:hypothetical protein